MTSTVQNKLVDWHQVWKGMMENCSLVAVEQGTMKQWTVIEAEEFLKNAGEQYVKQVMNKLNVTSNDTVLDVGCGPGRLTIPLAKVTKSVTAVDLSPGMLEVAKRRAKEEGLDNITFVNKFWREIKIGKDIKQEYDVTIASNAINLLGSKETQNNGKKMLDWNLAETLLKIDAVGKNNYITMSVLHHKDFSRIFDAMGKKYQPFPNYIVVHNVLHQLLIKPRIDYIVTACKKHNKPEKVLKRIEWICDISPEEKEQVKQKLLSTKVDTNSGLQVWALMSWQNN
ncbi:MAG: class I SAM-dependent methyltransferase [Candidatus Bathyarchaeota archaeon]|nr:class I SAM-dependent methyltransferase [Candidatus Bathyarchaeota archaeon]